jgi:hypothetical protein
LFTGVAEDGCMSPLLIALLAWLVAALVVYLAEDAEGERQSPLAVTD